VENNIRRINLRSMKTKLYKILGVALTLVLLASLTVGLTTLPTGAASSNLKFVKLELPRVEEWTDEASFADSEGDFWATPGIDLGPIAQTPDGDILFVAVADGIYLGNNWFDVLKSSDDGYSWTVTGFYEETADTDIDPVTAGVQPDTSPVVDIVTSAEYSDDTTVAVATMIAVYISDDGGKNFTALDFPWYEDYGAYITDMDMVISEDGDQALMVGTAGGTAYENDVWVTKGLLAWTPQDIDDADSYDLDVFACKFLPTFADDGDIGICAIASDGYATQMMFSFADIGDGGEWGDAIAHAPFTTADGGDFALYYGVSVASIAFPDDFDAFGVGNNVCFAGITTYLDWTDPYPDDGSDAYSVTCKEAGTSKAEDLDVRGVLTTLLPTATPVTSIDVCGDAEDATILVGVDNINLWSTPEMFSVYYSEDSGDSWTHSSKCPTGGAEWTPDLEYGMASTRVLMAPDFCDSGLAYASTWGYRTDAFQKTTDGGESWNQISLIDYGYNDEYWVTNYGFNAFGYNADDTLFMLTSEDTMTPGTYNVTNGALWGLLDGNHWERMLSYATPGVGDELFKLDILMDGSAIFASDLNNGIIWRSTDMGATWPKKISTKDGLQWVTPVSSTTIYTSHAAAAAGGSGIWWTERSGTGWQKPDDSDIPATAVIWSVAVMGDVVYCGSDAGAVFISSDGGETVERVGTTGPFTGFSVTLPTTDIGFADNGIMYATNPAGADTGVMRASVDLDDPSDAEWERIDDDQDSTNNVGDTDDYYPSDDFMAGSPAICLPPSGILYVADASGVDPDYPNDFGGLWRSTNPTDDTDSVYPPYFERETKGLDDGASIGLRSLDLAPPALAPTFFFANGCPDEYYEQIVVFTDILNVGPTLATPAADATGVGLLPENMVGDVYPVVTFGWEDMTGATGFQFQVSIDADFKTKVLNLFTDDLGIIIDDWLLANSTYYWRVRVAEAGSLIGAPLISPWSQTFKFKTVIGPSMQRPVLQAPLPGEMDVPLSPTFEWSGIEWAETYEYELALSPTTTAGGYFTEPLVALVSADALVSTAWKSDITLDYSTRYYWHVKALGVDTDTPWSDVGTFTTMGVPAEPPTTQPPVVIPPAENITPAWIWAIVIIGAILVIAVIVLIVTTRRVP
jgi:hypothetical protein